MHLGLHENADLVANGRGDLQVPWSEQLKLNIFLSEALWKKHHWFFVQNVESGCFRSLFFVCNLQISRNCLKMFSAWFVAQIVVVQRGISVSRYHDALVLHHELQGTNSSGLLWNRDARHCQKNYLTSRIICGSYAVILFYHNMPYS